MIHEAYPSHDIRISARHDNQVMSPFTPARSYSPPSHIYDDSSHPSLGMDRGWSGYPTPNYVPTSGFSGSESASYPNSPRIPDIRHSYRYSREPYADVSRYRASSPALARPNVSEFDYSHHVVSNPRHQCTYCGKKFSRPSGLKIHLTTHTGDKRE